MIDRLLARLNALLLHHPKRVLFVAFLVVAGFGLMATRLRLDPDVLNLIPRNNREVNEFRELITQTGTLDFHVVVVQFPKGADPANYASLLDEIGEGLRASKNIDSVTWRLPDVFSAIDKVLPYSLLVLHPSQMDAVAAKLSDEGIRAAVERNRALLQTPQSTIQKQIVRVDPFNLLPLYTDKLRRAGGGLKVDLSSGYYVSADHTAAIIVARPKTAAQQLPFSRAVMQETRDIVAKALQSFRANNPETPEPAIDYTGGYAIAAADEKIIRRDMAINSFTSMAGVLLLYLYAYRRPSALLAGLGVDFMTVLYERYVDERNRGAAVEAAVSTLIRKALPGVIVGALTTAATFYAFLATDFRGMTELGFLTGSGIMVFLLCVMFVFPAVLILVERRRAARRTLRVHAFGSGGVVRGSLRRPRAVIVAWLVLVLVAGIAATGVRFSDNLQNLRSKGNEAIKLQDVVTEKFGQSFEFMMYGVRGKTASEAIEKTERAIPDLEAITRKGVLGSYESVTTFLPGEAQQRQVIARLQQGADDEFSFARIERTFRQALVGNGFRAEAYDDWLPLFREALQMREPLTIETLQQLGLADAVQRFIKKTPDGFMSIVYVYPPAGTWPRFLPEELQQFRRDHPEGVLTGVNLVSQTLRTITRDDAIRASLLGFALVFGLVWIGFRSFSRACFVWVPFIAGCTCMLGFMAVFGFEFNFMNVFVGLMLIGTATDYAVYMLERYDESPDDFPVNAQETGRAVVLAALMSIVGFASFAISHYPGVRSIGYASVVGIALSCLASITLLPALLATGKFRRR
ncbi:MAG TPA: MMPL family transporter [Thermoanaerobaculia bacterium]|nr:MMPL family transporter [Thermoanaerobaculia bacterium]